jgi:hypothetical protein
MLTKEDYKSRLTEIALLKDKIQLDKDPVAAGLPSFNSKLAELQAIRERVTALLTEAIWNKTNAQSQLNDAEYDYETKSHALGVTEPIQKLKSKEIRESQISVTLTSELGVLHKAQKEHLFAETYLKNVYAIEKELEIKNDNLLQQIKTVQIMLHVDPALRDELKYR